MQNKIKAITLWQPWATFMALDIKQNETRGWDTSYRGPLGIHAANRPPFINPVLSRYLEELHLDPKDLPLGAMLCIRDLHAVVPTELVELTKRERDLGDYTRGRFAWRSKLIETFDEPIPCRGHQRLWNWGISARA